jgi:PAS domain S-box-containing protein
LGRIPDDHGITRAVEFFEMSLDHLCVAGFDGYWKWLNPAWSRTLGWTDEELLSRPTIEFVHPEDRAATLGARGRLKDGEPVRALTNRYLCKDGSHRWFEWRSVAHVERQLVYCIARDVTADREAQEALRQLRDNSEHLRQQLLLADRMASVGTLAAGVAHEINNPLAYVMTNLQLLREELAHGESLDLVTEALDGADRIRRIVRELIVFSRGEDGGRAVLDVRPVLDRAIELTHTQIRHRARLVKDYGEVPRVEADASRLGQVFISLLVNAVQAIADGAAETNEIRVTTATAPDGRAVIEVHDTGCGIPADALPRVFDPFFTTKPVGTGTGLGLAICHTIVTSLGGHIVAANREERGARLTVTLPAAAR